MGGFTANNAFGMEGSIPAAWIDNGPFTPREGFEVGFTDELIKIAKDSEFLGSLLAGTFNDHVWEDIENRAKELGVNLNEHLPELELPKGPKTKRKIFVTANKNDNTVPYSSSEKLVALIKKLPDQYTLEEFWTLDDKCNGETHCIDMFTNSESYEAKLCKFWSDVFGTKGCTSDGSVRLYELSGGSPAFGSALPNSPMFIVSFASVLVVGFVVSIARRVRSQHESRALLVDDAEEDQNQE
jgi:hypothetical protein